MKFIVALIAVFLGAQAQQQAPPAIVIRPPDSTTATETQTARFTCAAYGYPLPTISWTQTQGNLATKLTDDTSGYRSYTETLIVNEVEFAISVLEICGVSSDKADTYTCTASNGVAGVGVADSFASFALVVTAADQQPAAIVTGPSDATIDYGSSVEAVCVAYGNPLPSISWTSPSCPACSADDLLRSDAGTTTVTNQVVSYGDVAFMKSTLTLCGAVDTDSASTFQCMAFNGVAGTGIAANSAQWTLTVNDQVAPTTTGGGGATTVGPTETEGTTARLEEANERAYQGVVAFETILIVVLIAVVVALIIFIVIKSRQGPQKPDIPRPPRDPHVRKEKGFENPLHGDHDGTVDVDTMTYADLAKKLDD